VTPVGTGGPYCTALEADPAAWAEDLEERRSREGTLMDDLEDGPREEG
jgi:hypothetical protein